MSRRRALTAEDLIGLYDVHARDLLGYLARRTGNPQVALDLLAATFLAAFENRDRCLTESERERVAWLYRVAANILVDQVRRDGVERRAVARLAGELRALTPFEVAAIDRLAGSSELHDRVTAAFGDLSAEQRQALWLHVVEGRPYPELARTLGVSEPAVRARVSRGLRTLRHKTGERRKEPS